MFDGELEFGMVGMGFCFFFNFVIFIVIRYIEEFQIVYMYKMRKDYMLLMCVLGEL